MRALVHFCLATLTRSRARARAPRSRATPPRGVADLRDPWNVLDFTVVATSAVDWIPGMPQTSGLRTLRILRPLKSLNKLPGLQVLVVSMLKSVTKLVSVITLLMFIFAVFGILGVQLFAGAQHARCRLTPYPVTHGWTPGANFSEFACLDISNPEAHNFMSIDEHPGWTKSSSVWATPRDCYWPVDEDDTRNCATKGSDGRYECCESHFARARARWPTRARP